MRRVFPALLAALVAVFFVGRARASVLLWAPPDQGDGATDSSAALLEALEDLGVETVLAADLLAEDLGRFQTVLAVLGTFPRNHVLTEEEADGLAAHLRDRRGSLYIEGGDAWIDMPPALAALCGVSVEGDGLGDLVFLEGLDASPGPDLQGLEAIYSGENRSLDRLRPEGSARALWRNGATGAVVGFFNAPDGGGRVIGTSFEFGGLPDPRKEVLRWCLTALGAIQSCLPPIRDLSVSASGRRLRLEWKNPAAFDSIRLEIDSGPPQRLFGTSTQFEGRIGPGDHGIRLIGTAGLCEAPAAFGRGRVLSGAHVIWEPPETHAGPQDSAGEVRAAMESESNGRATVSVPSLSGLDLREAAGLWAILGTHPYHHPLSSEEGKLLADYLTGGLGPEEPRLYLEGGDIWGRDKPTDLRALDGVLAVADEGPKKLRHVRGLDTGQGLDIGGLVRLPVDYISETDSLDIISADPAAAGAGAAWTDDDSGEILGVYRRDPEGKFAMLSASFEFGGVTRTREERELLMGLYLTALERPGPRFRRGDVDGGGDINLTDPIQILGALFLAEPMSQDCEDAADIDDDGEIALTDAVVILNYMFLSGKPPPDPGPDDCGRDPTADFLEECRPLPAACR